MRSRAIQATLVLGLALGLAGCSSQADDAAAQPDGAVDPLVVRAVADYEAYVRGQIDDLIPLTRTFTDAVRAGDLAAAEAAYAPSRVPWERIEPIAGLVEEWDGAVDARVDDFESVDDPDFTGWHRLEYLVFDQQTTDGGAPFADQLDADLASLQLAIADLEIPAVQIPIGASELIEEVSLGKITGEENRYAKTDLWDIEANLDGSQAAIDTLAPALQAADQELLDTLATQFAAVLATLEPLRTADGWVLYCLVDDPFPSPRCPSPTVDQATVNTLQSQLAGLSESTSQVAGALDLA